MLKYKIVSLKHRYKTCSPPSSPVLKDL